MPSKTTSKKTTKTKAKKTTKQNKEPKKLKIGWFSFSCCEDNTIVFTEILNDHWQEWKKLLDFRYARVLQRYHEMSEFDIAFIEGAIASETHAKKVKEIRKRSKKLIAIGSCAVVGMPAGQRNSFTPEQKKRVKPILDHFASLPKVLKVSEVVKVDDQVPGCAMEPANFLKVLNRNIEELTGGKK